MRSLLAGLLFLLAVAAVAEACSFEREPPAPGAFYIWDLESTPVAVPVRERGLGGTCELANVHALGDVFVHGVGHRDGARLLFFERDGTLLGEALLPTGPVRGLGVEGGVAYALVSVHPEQPMRAFRATAQGVVEELASLPGLLQAMDGRVAVVLEAGRLRAVDLESGAVVVGPVEARAPVEGAGLAAADRERLVFDEWRREGQRLHVRGWDSERWRTHDVARFSWPLALDGDAVVYATRDDARVDLHRLELQTGADRVLGSSPAMFLGAAHDGHVVLGVYSAPGLEGEWTVRQEAPAGPVAAVAVLAAVWLRRRRA